MLREIETSRTDPIRVLWARVITSFSGVAKAVCDWPSCPHVCSVDLLFRRQIYRSGEHDLGDIVEPTCFEPTWLWTIWSDPLNHPSSSSLGHKTCSWTCIMSVSWALGFSYCVSIICVIHTDKWIIASIFQDQWLLILSAGVPQESEDRCHALPELHLEIWDDH